VDFPTTRWSRIEAAKRDPRAREKLIGELFRVYWQPVYIFARRKGLDAEAARDAVQGLFLRLFERRFVETLEASRGRLRSYLRTAMSHYLADERERQAAQKRGGALSFQALDTAWADRALADTRELTPEQAYERAWAQLVMERAFERLRREYMSGERAGPFGAIVDSFRWDETASQAEIAARHELTVSQLKSLLFRARHRLRQLIANEIGDTVQSPDDAADERTQVEDAVTRRSNAGAG
jgi:RNA polymerase sigma factor (sigma-70 family)